MPPELVLGAAKVGAYPLEPAYVCAYRTVGFGRSIHLGYVYTYMYTHVGGGSLGLPSLGRLDCLRSDIYTYTYTYITYTQIYIHLHMH